MADVKSTINFSNHQQETFFVPHQLSLFSVSKKNTYEERQHARKARYERQAENARKQSEIDSHEGVSMLKVIPSGQPILVGHHSERAHRNLLARSDNKMRKSIEGEKKAEYYEDKAKAVGKGGISGDDPQAIQKIEDKIKGLNDSHALMKAANKILRKNPHDKEGLLALGMSEDVCDQVLNPPSWLPAGYAGFELSGNRAEIKRLQQRLNELKKRAQYATSEMSTQHYTYRHDVEENRVMFIFNGKPEEKKRALLKQHAFKWSPRRGAWVRQATINGLNAARSLRRHLNIID